MKDNTLATIAATFMGLWLTIAFGGYVYFVKSYEIIALIFYIWGCEYVFSSWRKVVQGYTKDLEPKVE